MKLLGQEIDQPGHQEAEVFGFGDTSCVDKQIEGLPEVIEDWNS